MSDTNSVIGDLSREYVDLFQKRQVILSFTDFIDLIKTNPRSMIRNSAEYIRDTFDYFGKRELDPNAKASLVRYNLFDEGTEKTGAIVGCESVQGSVYNILQSFIRQGAANKLILLHGPNGSAKTSSIDSISQAMARYSETKDGSVYRFNWIFPTDKNATPRIPGESGSIGFATSTKQKETTTDSYALLDDSLITSRITSEFKDNPIYLIPMPQREVWLREWVAAKEGIKPEDVELPPHVLFSGLSKRNQLILENLLNAYDGNIESVLKHVQVERFFYSRQYRVGISTIEPQMAVDAREQQLTMDQNMANLPTILQNVSFHQAAGELIEANRGLCEFSDMLKRPPEAYKYLLTTIERQTLNLPSSTANLDVVFMGTTNEKHLDGFKTIPDFGSFRARFELVTVPYLLTPTLEEKIYAEDARALAKTIKITPHSLRLLCTWAVLTRIKQPDAEHYEGTERSLVGRLDPRSKVRLYEKESLKPTFKADDEIALNEMHDKIKNESLGLIIYEGRFGASPREVRVILHRAAQNSNHVTLTPMAVFDELKEIVKDKSVYEFLQFETRGKYHDAAYFIEILMDEFVEIFDDEIMKSMQLVEELEYDRMLRRYVEHVVAFVKGEKVLNQTTNSYEAPSEQIMKDIEELLAITEDAKKHREGLLAKIASHKLENPKDDIEITVVFEAYLTKIREHYYSKQRGVVETNYNAMLALDTSGEQGFSTKEIALAKETYAELNNRFGYDDVSARECLKFLVKRRQDKK